MRIYQYDPLPNNTVNLLIGEHELSSYKWLSFTLVNSLFFQQNEQYWFDLLKKGEEQDCARVEHNYLDVPLPF